MEQEHLLSSVGAKKALERLQQNLADKLKQAGLKLLYVPPFIVERARQVMGTIDYDPTSDPVQQCIVDATSVPSIEINPLQEHWHGNVFVAAKGAVKNSRLWFHKTLDEYRNGHIDQFIFFTNASELMRAARRYWTIHSASHSNVSSNSVLTVVALKRSVHLPGTSLSMAHQSKLL